MTFYVKDKALKGGGFTDTMSNTYNDIYAKFNTNRNTHNNGNFRSNSNNNPNTHRHTNDRYL